MEKYNYKITKHTYSRFFDGVELLRVFIGYPLIEESEKISSFYESYALEMQKYCDEKLFARLSAEYQNNNDRRKKYRYPVFMFNSVSYVTCFSKPYFSQRSMISLSRGGEIYNEMSQAMTWNVEKQILCRPKYFFVPNRDARKLIRAKKQFYIDDNGVNFICGNGTSFFPFSKNLYNAAIFSEQN